MEPRVSHPPTRQPSPGAQAPARDPRPYQIAVLSGLLLYGLFVLRFDVTVPRVAVTLGAGLAAQALWTRLARLPRFDSSSALISALSLCLLLRTSSLAVAALASCLAVSSKFLVRWRGKHVFNPSNLALVVLLALPVRAWVSPGQWGSLATFAFLLACAGGLVVHRALRSDVTYAFLAAYAGLLAWRTITLGDPWSIPLHQMESGALVLFAFFMISDPRTTPDSRLGRIVFGVAVAALAHFITFRMFRTNGLLWALAALSPTVPLLDRLVPGPRFVWRPLVPPSHPSPKGVSDETLVISVSRDPLGAAARP
ncbi:MAG TPA: RnfABCDGE type electron transport complex subunit D [Candidatus Eisenbacteria bacterium]|nr:RnfABCDGE type electron transport complex subunit D [Candidatus Eisenbacteria bacterium]